MKTRTKIIIAVVVLLVIAGGVTGYFFYQRKKKKAADDKGKKDKEATEDKAIIQEEPAKKKAMKQAPIVTEELDKKLKLGLEDKGLEAVIKEDNVIEIREKVSPEDTQRKKDKMKGPTNQL